MSSRRLGLVVVLLLTAFVLPVLHTGRSVVPETDTLSFGKVDLRVYVIALENVGGKAVGNISRAIEGALEACRVNSTQFYFDYKEWDFGEIALNVSGIVVREWNVYKSIVESESNKIVVNLHGELIPVPSGYSRVGWIDVMADAMLHRNLTWVHTAGYPFYYSRLESGEEGVWGEAGLQRLMGHIGKGHVTCYAHRERDLEDMHSDACYILGWPHSWDVSGARRVQAGKRLKGSDFTNYTVFPIWGITDGYMTGAVIKFAEEPDAPVFGLYVHIGTNQTYTFSYGDYVPTDGDYWRAYIGTASAVWANAFRWKFEELVRNATCAIDKAEHEGRTKGLDEAKQLLQQAKDYFYNKNRYEIALKKAFKAELKAESAERYTLSETLMEFINEYRLELTVGGILSLTCVTMVLAVVWAREIQFREPGERKVKLMKG